MRAVAESVEGPFGSTAAFVGDGSGFLVGNSALSANVDVSLHICLVLKSSYAAQ